MLAVELVELHGPFLGGSPSTVAVFTRAFSLVDYEEAFLDDGTGRYRTVVE